jgi:hypothetical protein
MRSSRRWLCRRHGGRGSIEVTASEALAILDANSLLRYGLGITSTSARVYVAKCGSVRVRRGKAESIEAMVIRLAQKTLRAMEKGRQKPRPKPSPRTKAHLRRVREIERTVN